MELEAPAIENGELFCSFFHILCLLTFIVVSLFKNKLI